MAADGAERPSLFLADHLRRLGNGISRSQPKGGSPIRWLIPSTSERLTEFVVNIALMGAGVNRVLNSEPPIMAPTMTMSRGKKAQLGFTDEQLKTMKRIGLSNAFIKIAAKREEAIHRAKLAGMTDEQLMAPCAPKHIVSTYSGLALRLRSAKTVKRSFDDLTHVPMPRPYVPTTAFPPPSRPIGRVKPLH